MPTGVRLAGATRGPAGDGARDNDARATRVRSRRGDSHALRRGGDGRALTVREVWRRAKCERDADARRRTDGRGGAQHGAYGRRHRAALCVPRSGRLDDTCGNPSTVGARHGCCRASRGGPSNASRTSRSRRGGRSGHARRLGRRHRAVGRDAVGRSRGSGDRGRRGRRNGRRLIGRRRNHGCGWIRRRRRRTSRAGSRADRRTPGRRTRPGCRGGRRARRPRGRHSARSSRPGHPRRRSSLSRSAASPDA